MLKKILASVFLLIVFIFLSFYPVLAQSNTVTLHLFWAKGCPHCEQERIFLDTIKEKYPELSIKEYELTTEKKNVELVQLVGKELSINISSVPLTIIGREYIVGFENNQTTGKEIEEKIVAAKQKETADIVEKIKAQNFSQSQGQGKPSSFSKAQGFVLLLVAAVFFLFYKRIRSKKTTDKIMR